MSDICDKGLQTILGTRVTQDSKDAKDNETMFKPYAEVN